MSAPFRGPCTCCGSAIPSRAAWLALKQIGRQEDGEGGSLALANCQCGSTLAIDALTLDGPGAELLAEASRVFFHEAAAEPDDEERIRLYAAGCELADRADEVADKSSHSGTRMKCSRYRAA